MAETLHTKKEAAQFRGPSTSDNYNERQENLYKDLIYLANKIGIAEEDIDDSNRSLTKQLIFLTRMMEDLEQRVESLEEDSNKMTFRSSSQIDTDRFNGTLYNVPPSERLSHDPYHGLITLPIVDSASSSKIAFTSDDGSTVLPSSFEMRVVGVSGTADSSGVTIDTSDPYLAVMSEIGKLWERNVVAETESPSAEMYVYIKIPTDVSVNVNTNYIGLHPFPTMGCELLEVAYSTSVEVNLNDSDVYRPINFGTINPIHEDNPDAIGWVVPGTWVGDSIIDCGPKAFHFDQKAITSVRLQLRQSNFLKENNKYVYTYGFSDIDIAYKKFLPTGKLIVRFDAPDNSGGIGSIDSNTALIPDIWNVSEAEAPHVFSYRLIWETSYNSGVYTLSPVYGASRVWVEVTLNETLGKGTPALSGLRLNANLI